MIIRVIETPQRSSYYRNYKAANSLARVVIALIRRPLLDEQDLVYLKKLGLETEVVTQKE